MLAIAADVNKDDDVKRIVETTAQHFGQIDILVGFDLNLSSCEVYNWVVSMKMQ